jgi:riboflavin biosynthesis pyrimidine reductase
VIRQALRAGYVEELSISVAPVILGAAASACSMALTRR